MQSNPHHERVIGLALSNATIADSDAAGADIPLPAKGEDLVLTIHRDGTIGAAFSGSTLYVKVQGKTTAGAYEDLKAVGVDKTTEYTVQFDTTSVEATHGAPAAFATGTSFQTGNICMGTIPMNSVKAAADGAGFVAYRVVARDPSAGGEAISVGWEWANLKKKPGGTVDYLFGRVRYV